MVSNPQCQHHDRFYLSLSEYPKIQESTFSVRHVEFDPDVIVSCQDHLKCQKFDYSASFEQVGSDVLKFISSVSMSSKLISLWF